MNHSQLKSQVITLPVVKYLKCTLCKVRPATISCKSCKHYNQKHEFCYNCDLITHQHQNQDHERDFLSYLEIFRDDFTNVTIRRQSNQLNNQYQSQFDKENQTERQTLESKQDRMNLSFLQRQQKENQQQIESLITLNQQQQDQLNYINNLQSTKDAENTINNETFQNEKQEWVNQEESEEDKNQLDSSCIDKIIQENRNKTNEIINLQKVIEQVKQIIQASEHNCNIFKQENKDLCDKIVIQKEIIKSYLNKRDREVLDDLKQKQQNLTSQSLIENPSIKVEQ